jgi:hypothetical protein
MKNDKSPGPGGFSCEFLKFFRKDIGTFLRRAINKSYGDQQFSEPNKLSVITCIPKPGKATKNIPGLLILIGFEKAFDTVS